MPQCTLGDEAYALWGDAQKFDATKHETQMKQFEKDQEATHLSIVMYRLKLGNCV